jgi:hypothetical protein
VASRGVPPAALSCHVARVSYAGCRVAAAAIGSSGIRSPGRRSPFQAACVVGRYRDASPVSRRAPPPAARSLLDAAPDSRPVGAAAPCLHRRCTFVLNPRPGSSPALRLRGALLPFASSRFARRRAPAAWWCARGTVLSTLASHITSLAASDFVCAWANSRSRVPSRLQRAKRSKQVWP